MEEIPSDSSEDDVSGSDDDILPEKGANETDSAAEDAEGVEVEEAEDVPPTRASIWKIGDNQFEGDLPPFLGQWKANVQGTEPVEFFMHLFPEELNNDIVFNTNLYALQKGKENLAVTSDEIKTFLGINMVMS